MRPSGGRWEEVVGRMRILPLTSLAQVLVPSLLVSTPSRGTRGVSFYPGRIGLSIGISLLVASAALGWLLWGKFGILGAGAAFWLIGTTGVLQVASSREPLTFVKPLCLGCRLLPVIVEHEAIHLSGVAAEKAVWASMRTRYSPDSLKLEGDPMVCSFCPIPKRLSEH
jgi:hypothetical protein